MMDTSTEQAPVVEPVASAPTAPEADSIEEAGMSREAMRARWQARRPNIDHLKSGIVAEGDLVLPVFDVGERIVVDVRTRFLGGDPWLHTLVGKVRSIDDETGLVSLLDEESDPRSPMVRWVSFKDELHDFRLAPLRGDPFAVSAVRAPKQVAAPVEGKRGRGRPAGSRNRSKEEIQAEREAYRKMREEKKARRGKR